MLFLESFVWSHSKNKNKNETLEKTDQQGFKNYLCEAKSKYWHKLKYKSISMGVESSMCSNVYNYRLS